MGTDDLVEIGLSEERFVTLVVPVSTITDDVDNDVPAELLPECKGDAGRLGHGDRIISVHMEDGGLHDFGKIGAVRCRSGIRGKGGKTDLVIDDKVDGSADLVARQL